MKSLQNEEIKIRWVPKKLNRGKKTILKITLKIPEGIHIQAHKPVEELLIPTKIALKEKMGLSFGQPAYPKPKLLPTSWSEVKLLVYEGEVDIFMPLEVSNNAKSGKNLIEGILAFQGCTVSLCLPPKKQQFTLTLQVS